ncbi:MAG: hypothetical protein JWL83_4895, partial [Actinomycetia bacterium]|nr:hypothetical protein [Actinomycetes bacterium]
MFSRPAIARLVVASGILASSLAVAVPAAHAKSGDVRKTVTCSKGSRATLKIGARDGVIETEFEVDSNVVGQRWSNTITDNGTTVFSGARKTTAPSGSFTIETRPA